MFHSVPPSSCVWMMALINQPISLPPFWPLPMNSVAGRTIVLKHNSDQAIPLVTTPYWLPLGLVNLYHMLGSCWSPRLAQGLPDSVPLLRSSLRSHALLSWDPL